MTTHVVITIDQLIAAHWNGCTVQRDESPEAYAIRRQIESWFKDGILCAQIGLGGVVKITHSNGEVEILRWEGDL